jgi:hypothetical protein
MQATAGRKSLQHTFDAEGSPFELRPQSLESAFWNSFRLAVSGRVLESLPLFRRIFAKDEEWVIVLKKLLRADPIDDLAMLLAILEATYAEKNVPAQS